MHGIPDLGKLMVRFLPLNYLLLHRGSFKASKINMCFMGNFSSNIYGNVHVLIPIDCKILEKCLKQQMSKGTKK